MKVLSKLFVSLLTLTFLLSCFTVYADAENTDGDARNITSDCNISVSPQISLTELTDDKYTTFSEIPEESAILISAKENIGGIYLKFYSGAVEWELYKDTENHEVHGKMGYLHEYVPIETQKEITLKFPTKTALSEVTVYSQGTLPDDVQVWNAPCEKADLMLLSTHADDEHLFFAGVIPWTLSRGAALQVVYMTNHRDTPSRLHEQLNGLWAVGVRNYPEIGPFPDLYSTSLEAAKNAFGNYGYNWDDFVKFQTDMIRKFKPQVIVGHDINGEYSHGAHILNTATLFEALELSGKNDAYPESAQNYGVWNVPKTYIHLYNQNEIKIDIDTPLEYYKGKTAYQVSCTGYGYHYSQHWTWFTEWLLGQDGQGYDSSDRITSYSPSHYGLYKTIVGNDVSGNDFFENITLYKDIKPPETTEETYEEPPSATHNTPVISDTPSDEKDSRGLKSSIMYVFLALLAAAIFITLIMIIFTAIPQKRKKRRNRQKYTPVKSGRAYTERNEKISNKNSGQITNINRKQNSATQRIPQNPREINKRK